jgi:MOSC domain-containing protein YiiM
VGSRKEAEPIEGQEAVRSIRDGKRAGKGDIQNNGGRIHYCPQDKCVWPICSPDSTVEPDQIKFPATYTAPLKNRKAARRTCSITTPPSPICAPAFRAAAAWPGSVCARRPAPRAAIRGVDSARLTADAGIEGDHRAARGGGKRQVTLIQQEHLGAIAALAGFDAVDPALLRRNLVVSGISLVALKDRCFRIGEAVLEGTGDCQPARAWRKPWGRAATTRCAAMAASRTGSCRVVWCVSAIRCSPARTAENERPRPR